MVTTRSKILGILIDSFPMEVPANDLQKMLDIPISIVSGALLILKVEGKVENNSAGWFLHNIHAKGFYVEAAPGSIALITVNEGSNSYVIEVKDNDCVLIENCLEKSRLIYQN